MQAKAERHSQDLQEAFECFQGISAQLVSSYRGLTEQVDQLHAELAQARHERVRQQDENSRLGRRLQSLINALPAALIVLDGEGRVVECNPAATDLLGDPLVGAAWRDIIVRAFSPRADDGHDISLRDGRRVSIQTRPAGDEPGQILLITDVSETRALQEALSRHRRLSAMGEMLAALAHQVRTPLAAALLYTSHLQRAELPGGERQRIVAKIQDRIRHLETLVNDMLLYAKSGSLDLEPLSVAELFNEVQALAEPALTAQDASLYVEIGDNEMTLSAHRVALASAMQNLIINALQAIPKGARLTLSAQASSSPGGIPTIDISLTDNGPGIAADVQERIFEPFYTTRAQGNGLGLAVVRAIVEAHQGAVWVESQAGQGSRFGMRLPALLSVTTSVEGVSHEV